ncbi:MAG: OmpH family outer membrane protein [Tannerella sp.]|jgi:outer membrane protein|nr:OmpH family outer membrane protein [Tannerella sp.]
MKDKIHYVIEAALAVAVLILFALNFTDKGQLLSGQDAADGAKVDNTLPIAYVDMDSLLSYYSYSIDLNEQLMKKYENVRATMTEKQRKFEVEATDFQRKVETNSFLSQERAKSEQQRLLSKQEELRRLDAEQTQKLSDEQARMNEDLRSTIIKNVSIFNKDKGYQLIMGKIGENILYSNRSFNITSEIIEYLNKQYAVSPLIKATD